MDPKVQVEDVLAECAATLEQHLEGRMVAPEALAFWRSRYRARFLAALNRSGDWQKDRLHVLTRVRRMVDRAAALAEEAGSPVITVAHARQASEATDCKPERFDVSFTGWCYPEPTLPPPAEREAGDWLTGLLSPAGAAVRS